MPSLRSMRGLTELSAPGKRIQSRARGFLALFIILAGLFVIHDFLPAFLWGGILAICSWPVYQKAEALLGRQSWLPAILTALLALALLIPLVVIGFQILDETSSLFNYIDRVRRTGIPQPAWLAELPFGAAPLGNWWRHHLADAQYLSHLLKSFKIGRGLEFTRKLGTQAAKRSLQLVFALLTFFFLLKDGNAIVQKSLIGSRRIFGRQGEILARQIVASIHGTLSGLVLVGLAEGAAMGVIYVFAHAPQPLLFGFITAIAAMIPVMGIVTVGFVSLLLLMQAKILAAVLTFGLGAVILFFADHFIRPALIGGTTKLPFLWVLAGILGGAETWGLLGLFLGPAIMSCLYLLWRIWTTNPHQKRKCVKTGHAPAPRKSADERP